MFKSLPAHLKPALLIFASVMIIMTAAIAVSAIYRDDAEQSENSAKRAMYIWKNKIEGSRQSDKLIDKYEQDYLSLVKKGVIGNEDRLSWFETIQHISDSRGMPSVKYAIASQKKVETPTTKQKYNGLVLYRSVMTLDIIMGDEDDLFALLNGLQDRARGLFTVDNCNLKLNRPDGTPVYTISTNQMKAHCELSWYTIKAAQ